jgi:hypothetical protein
VLYLKDSRISLVLLDTSQDVPYGGVLRLLCLGNMVSSRTVARSTSMGMAAYGIEAICEGQPWIVQSFHKLIARIGRDVSGTFASTIRVDARVDAIREAAIPPTRAALDPRTERQFIRMIANSKKRLVKFLEITTIGKVGPDKIDDEIRRTTGYEEWCNLVEDSDSEDDEAVSHGSNNEARGTIIVRPPLRAA